MIKSLDKLLWFYFVRFIISVGNFFLICVDGIKKYFIYDFSWGFFCIFKNLYIRILIDFELVSDFIFFSN